MRNNKFQDPRDSVVINERIKYSEVRVTYQEQNNVMSIDAALSMAYDLGLDLVLVSEKASPPLCRVVDVGKYIYEQKQREKEAKKKQRESIIEQKEIRMGLNIDKNDLQTKANHVKKFVSEQAKVTVSVVLKGRERGRQDMARELLERFAQLASVEYEMINTQHNRVIGRIK
jgi:translation initiation factor IF-3